MNKKRLIFIILILSFLILICFWFTKKQLKIQDELLFFKFFLTQTDKKTNIQNDYSLDSTTNKIIFEVSYKNINSKRVKLIDTINTKTLVNKKIAPGVKGKFEIQLNSNENLNYKIIFQNLSNKPKNLNFYINGKKIEKLLKGKIMKNEEKNIIVDWKWDYDISKIQDLEDTKDGKSLESYKFNIITIGYEM